MKRWYESRTIWLGVIAFADAVLVVNHELQAFPNLIPVSWLGAFNGLVAISTIVIRFKTTKAIGPVDKRIE